MDRCDNLREGLDEYFADLAAIFSNSFLDGLIYLLLAPLVIAVYYL